MAEKLEAGGRKEGREKGTGIRAIRMLEEFLGLPVSPTDSLGELRIEELESRQRKLRREYDARFKRS